MSPSTLVVYSYSQLLTRQLKWELTHTHTHLCTQTFQCRVLNVSWQTFGQSQFYRSLLQSSSISHALNLPQLLLFSFPSLFCIPILPPTPTLQPSCQCQCLMALSKAASPPLISIWEKSNWIGSQSITASIELWLDLAWDDRVRWVGWGGLVWF